MLMTAAGTVKAARVLVLGAGVAGLQAIATAKRLGAVIEASDVRPAVKEQVESLGAKFIDVPFETDEETECAEGVGGYARPMPAALDGAPGRAVHERAKQADIVITTALIPGRQAPALLHEDMVEEMKPGSVIIDLAAAHGGNCPLTEVGRVVVKHGVTLVGETATCRRWSPPTPRRCTHATCWTSSSWSSTAKASSTLNREDDIVAACLMCEGGQVLRRNAA